MNRSAKIALLIAGSVAACVFAACGVALALRDWVPGLAGCEDTGKPTKTHVVTEKIRIEQMYPQLKPIQAVHWQEREARARTCPEIGPMDYVMNGLAVITPERATALATSAPAPSTPTTSAPAPSTAAPSAAAPSTPTTSAPAPSTAAPSVAAPDIPVDLLPFAPPSPTWLAIGDTLLLDRASATVYFTHVTN